MIIYVENKIKEISLTKEIIAKFPDAEILEIDNYKNLFDKNLSGDISKCLILAGVNNAITQTPDNYGHIGKSFFFKNSLNCVFDCSYCYLKGAFKNTNVPVIFVNYADMKQQILEVVKSLRDFQNKEFRERNISDKETQSFSKSQIWFYTSDHSDNLAIDHISEFTTNFFPFFDSLENVKMEIRTKSANVSRILKLKPSMNVEVAFSLNPSEVIEKYELKTPALDMRIAAINTLIDAGWQVGVRFLPLIEIENYEEIYERFIEYVVGKIDFEKVHSVFIGGLLYTKEDYNKILKKEPYLDVLYKLEPNEDGFVREKREVRDFFYELFDRHLTRDKCNRCLDH